MSLSYIRNTYGVPAFRGTPIVYYPTGNPKDGGKRGRITSADGAYLRIRFDGENKTHPGRFHPDWNIIYNTGFVPSGLVEEIIEYNTSLKK